MIRWLWYTFFVLSTTASAHHPHKKGMEMQKKEKQDAFIDFLSDTLLFRDLSKEEIKGILQVLNGKIKVIEPGGIYLLGGETIEKMGIVTEGELIMSKVMDSGDENLIQKLLPGFMVGADVVCSPTQFNPFYIHAPHGAKVYEFPFKTLTEGKVPTEKVRAQMLLNMLSHLANENIRRQYKIDVLSENGLRDRILIYLRSRAVKLGTNSFTIPFNREEMANYLCVNRSALSHELSLMRSEGIISFRKNKFELL